MAFLLRTAPIMSGAILVVSYLVGYYGLVSGALPLDNLSRFWPQKPLSGHDPSHSPNFSVGFSLQSSYGAIAVMFEDGTTKTFKEYGDESYGEVMSRLSLDSSRHLAPPYEDPADPIKDNPRTIKRALRKSIGLPASADVGALAAVTRTLKDKAESELDIHISSAVIATSHLVALYQDDLKDAFEYVGIEYIEPKDNFKPVLWENAAANSGYGIGLCDHYTDLESCRKEENEMPDLSILAVHYSRTALMTSLYAMQTANGIWEPAYRHQENFALGYDALDDAGDKAKYWDDVREAIVACMEGRGGYNFESPDKVILTGDRVLEDTFTQVLDEAVKKVAGKKIPILSEDPEFVVAKGAAEQMRRNPFKV